MNVKYRFIIQNVQMVTILAVAAIFIALLWLVFLYYGSKVTINARYDNLDDYQREWHYIIKSLRRDLSLVKIVPRSNSVAIGSERAAQLLDCLQKHNITPPSWWRSNFIKCQCYYSDEGELTMNFMARNDILERYPFTCSDSNTGLILRSNHNLTINNGCIAIIRDEVEVRVDKKIYNYINSNKLHESIYSTFDNDSKTMYIAVHGGIYTVIKLFCIDCATSDVKWEEEVCIHEDNYISGSGGSHICALEVDAGRLTAFGCSRGAMYILKFDPLTGRCTNKICFTSISSE